MDKMSRSSLIDTVTKQKEQLQRYEYRLRGFLFTFRLAINQYRFLITVILKRLHLIEEYRVFILLPVVSIKGYITIYYF